PSFRSWLEQASPPDVVSRLAESDWLNDEKASRLLKQTIEPWCAHYLLNIKEDHEPVDPVARFHLRNGARLERLNWLGDTSPAGLQRSVGIMVNYVYRLGDVERNNESYM